MTLFLAVAIALYAAPAACAGGAAPTSVTASPALTWRTLWQTTLGAHSAAAVVNSRQDAWELFTQPSSTGWAIAGRHVFAGGAAGAPLVLVDGLGDVGALVAQRDRHDGFILVWKSGSTIWAQRFDSGGAPRFAAQPLVSDGEAATAGGVPSATATVTAVAADSSGGFYIGVAVSAASRSFGLIEYVSATGTPRLAPPGKVVSSAVAALAADSADHVFALLQSTTVAVQRYSTALVADWPAVRLSAAGATALSLNATSPATALWSTGRSLLAAAP